MIAIDYHADLKEVQSDAALAALLSPEMQCAPFDRLVAPDAEMRDEIVALTTRALKRGMTVYVLVNNKAEGSSPLTIEAIAERVAAVWTQDSTS